MSEKSWIIEAIEREAMARAMAKQELWPKAFCWKGVPVSEQQICWLLKWFEHNAGRPPSTIDPKADVRMKL